MLDVYEKRIVSRFADVKWDHVQYMGRNAANACVLVMVLNLPKPLRDLEEVIVDLQILWQQKGRRKKSYNSVVVVEQSRQQHRPALVQEHQLILI